MPAKWKTQQWPQDWKRSVFIPIPKKGNDKEYSNYHTIALISHASKVMPKFSKPGFNCIWTLNFQTFKLDLERADERNKEPSGFPYFLKFGNKEFMIWATVTGSQPCFCDPMDCSLSRSSIHGIFQARVLEWVAISFSRASFWPRDQTWVSSIVDRRIRDQIANICWIIEKAWKFQKKTSTSALSTTSKPLTVRITTNCGKFFTRWK